jgi:hypothetical protein
MAENHSPEDVATQTLGMRALLYASGSLDHSEAGSFETILAEDQRARDALCRAVRYLQDCGGTAASGPDPAYRRRVRQHLGNRGGWLVGWFPRRAYCGHPAAWGALGAAAALTFVLLMPELFQRATDSQLSQPTNNLAKERTPQPADEALIWAQMPRSERLLKMYQEENRRKQREGMYLRLAKMEEDRSRRTTPADGKDRVDQ